MHWLFRLTSVALLAVVSLSAAGELSGRRAPGFSLPDMNLKQHDIADYRGKIVLLDIMQTNCPHCREFTAILEQVKAKYGTRVAILSAVNPPDTTATVRSYLQQTKSTVPILFDCGQMSASYLKVTPQNPAISVPHLFIIDEKGWIINNFGYGPATKEIFEGRALFGELEKILNSKARAAKK